MLLFDTGPLKAKLGDLITSATEDIIADHHMAMDSAKWCRFDSRSLQRHRDGVTLDTVGLPPLITTSERRSTPGAAGESGAMWYGHSFDRVRGENQDSQIIR